MPFELILILIGVVVVIAVSQIVEFIKKKKAKEQGFETSVDYEIHTGALKYAAKERDKVEKEYNRIFLEAKYSEELSGKTPEWELKKKKAEIDLKTIESVCDALRRNASTEEVRAIREEGERQKSRWERAAERAIDESLSSGSYNFD